MRLFDLFDFHAREYPDTDFGKQAKEKAATLR